ncbi:MAG TPA: helix-turn-helix transcriptional regulator [Bacteroidales bacterium]|nr:helix-turn-helix transcriptional regulator [Bacteroidales bacterium]HPS63243.1 helix-turn-helix transcriptional regulator [Bacteroidales bacterium]
MKTLEQLHREYTEVLDSQDFCREELDYSILDSHIPYLQRIDQVSNTGITIFDLCQRKHVFVSDNVALITGPSNQEGSTNEEHTGEFPFHPDDLPLLYENGNYFLQYGIRMPVDRRKDYKLVTEYRLLTDEGRCIRVIEQQMILENDRRGNIWLGICILDLSPDQDPQGPFRSRLINIRTGDIFMFPPPGSDNSLTSREQEILKLIARGLISKEIADKLFISVNTVNTHRQRILEKLQAGNAMEAVRYAAERGWI